MDEARCCREGATRCSDGQFVEWRGRGVVRATCVEGGGDEGRSDSVDM